MINIVVNGANGTTVNSYTITITNSSGAIIKTITSSQPTWQNNVSSWQPGTYFIMVVDNSNKSVVGTSKFIKN